MLQLTFDAFQSRMEREHNERAWLAWHIAALMRVKRLPELKTMFVKKRQTIAEQKAMARMITSAMGGKIVRRRRR